MLSRNKFETSGGQIGDRGPHVYSCNVFGGPRKHSGKSSNLKYPPTHHGKRKCRANFNRDLLQFALEGTALRHTQPSESGPRDKLFAHHCSKPFK